MTIYTNRSWWTVEQASETLRVNRKTLYAAIRDGSIAATRVGPYYRIPAEALGLTVEPATRTRTYHLTDDVEQLTLPLGPIIPVQVYRNGGVKKAFDYERALWRL